MDDNPYRSPEIVDAQVVGVVSGRREDLRSVAKYQRVLMICILVYLVALLASWAVPQLLIVGRVVALVASLVGVVFVFLLSTKVYSTGIGVLLGILTLIPIIGLIVLLIINSKATGILRANGVRVGLLGADPATV